MFSFIFSVFGLMCFPMIYLVKVNFCWWFFLSSLYFLIFVSLSFFYHWGSFISYISSDFGLDSLSMLMFVLSLWVSSLMIIASNNNMISPNKGLSLIFLICFFLILSFSSLDLIMFYFYFEGVLIPTFILIFGWGGQPERIQAGIYILFYTVFASLPLLLVVLFLGENELSLSFYYLNIMMNSNNNYCWLHLILFLFSIFAFLVKIPIYFFHLWLPKAHVEAPISGSMILAAVLLKLGGYGLFRFVFFFSSNLYGMIFNFMCFVMLGGLSAALVCFMQMDMKALVAYSSIAHMSLVVGGILSFNTMGFNGALLIMIGHGLCSSGLFCLVNILYERSHSRSLMINNSTINILPGLGVWWFLLLISNISSPPSMNLLGEVTLFLCLIIWDKCMMFILFLFFFLCSCYSIYLYHSSQHGNLSNFFSLSLVKPREFLLVFSHWWPLNFFIFKPELFYFFC